MNKEIVKRLKDSLDYEFNLTFSERKELLSYIEQLEKENQQLKENYDRIYNENCKLREKHNITDISLLDENQQLKKQKDDVVELIKKQDKIRNYYEYEECGYDEYNYDDDFKEELLRMLGEIE